MKKKVLLIGGTSHAGKSTLARAFTARFGGTHMSTDMLARHPGRPWPSGAGDVPPHVVEHYSILSTGERMRSVIAHYRSLGPAIQDRIDILLEDTASGNGCVIEGSAVLPENAGRLCSDRVGAVWMTASDDFLEDRIRKESRYATVSGEGRLLIDNFIARTLAFNRWIMADVARLGLSSVSVNGRMSAEDVMNAALEAI